MLVRYRHLIAALLLPAGWLVAGPASAELFEGEDVDAGTQAAQFRFERQLRVNPFDPAALNNLAVVKARQGLYRDAYDLMRRSASLAPESKEIAENLARMRAWMDAVGDDSDELPAPELSLSRIPPPPPRLWEPAPLNLEPNPYDSDSLELDQLLTPPACFAGAEIGHLELGES